MLNKLQSAFWRALTPDLMPDEATRAQPATAPVTALADSVVAALGGIDNLVSQQRVALPRVRVQLRDATGLNEPALRAAGMPGVMVLENGVVHVLTPLPDAG